MAGFLFVKMKSFLPSGGQAVSRGLAFLSNGLAFSI
jgi:hypothetical protein